MSTLFDVLITITVGLAIAAIVNLIVVQERMPQCPELKGKTAREQMVQGRTVICLYR